MTTRQEILNEMAEIERKRDRVAAPNEFPGYDKRDKETGQGYGKESALPLFDEEGKFYSDYLGKLQNLQRQLNALDSQAMSEEAKQNVERSLAAIAQMKADGDWAVDDED